MKLLTSEAIQGYRDYTKRTIAYDTNNNLWLSKQESLKMDSVAEGFYYVCQLEISEREVEE